METQLNKAKGMIAAIYKKRKKTNYFRFCEIGGPNHTS